MINGELPEDETGTPVTLSVCLIVKDEERVLGRCLSAAIQFADELIVLDTGSADRSREIAGEYTDLVYDEPWQNSFAGARNFAASKASCDYVMWLDADDVIEPDMIVKLLDLKNKLSIKTDLVFMTYRSHGYLTDMILRDRIHRRKLACQWEGDIHEAIHIGDDWNLMLCPEIVITHKKEYVNEPDRNIRIFDAVIGEGRFSGSFMLAYYCRELAVRDRTDEALETWRELLDTHPPAQRVQYALVYMTGMLLRQGEYEKCRQLIRTSVDEYGVPLSAYLCYHLGLIAESLGDIPEAVEQYKHAAGLPVDLTSFMLEFAGYDDYRPCLKLCSLTYDPGKPDGNGESEDWNNRAGRAWPEGRAWRINRERFFTPPLPPGREPLVSVIMPVFNMEAHIAEAVSSILDQSWPNLELIIVDDASTDGTNDVIGGFSDARIRLLKNERNLGISASLNHAIRESRGEFIALMDARDVSLPGRLKAQLMFFENNRDVMILGTASSLMDREGRVLRAAPVMPGSPEHYLARLLIGKPEFCDSTAMIRRSFIEDGQLAYREGCSGLQDFRFYMEASKTGAISCLADTHHRHRLREDRVSRAADSQSPGEPALGSRVTIAQPPGEPVQGSLVTVAQSPVEAAQSPTTPGSQSPVEAALGSRVTVAQSPGEAAQPPTTPDSQSLGEPALGSRVTIAQPPGEPVQGSLVTVAQSPVEPALGSPVTVAQSPGQPAQPPTTPGSQSPGEPAQGSPVTIAQPSGEPALGSRVTIAQSPGEAALGSRVTVAQSPGQPAQPPTTPGSQPPGDRAQIYNRIRCDSLRMSGVKLSCRDESLLGELLPEDDLPLWNRQERETISGIFADIRSQLLSASFPAIRELDEIMFLILNH